MKNGSVQLICWPWDGAVEKIIMWWCMTHNKSNRKFPIYYSLFIFLDSGKLHFFMHIYFISDILWMIRGLIVFCQCNLNSPRIIYSIVSSENGKIFGLPTIHWLIDLCKIESALVRISDFHLYRRMYAIWYD